jgi:tight adherence protein B
VAGRRPRDRAAALGRRARARRLGDLESAPSLSHRGRALVAGGGDRGRRLARRRAVAARLAAAAYLDGPPAAELARLGAELDLGAGTAEAVAAWRTRIRSERVDAFAAALLSQRLAGGDLAGLLRRFAAGAAERDRVAEDARSATAQARFTGLLVVAMPTGGALFAELVQPGFLAKLLGSPAAAILLACAVGLQAIGFVAIHRLSRVVD